jgi:hypothetical protein
MTRLVEVEPERAVEAWPLVRESFSNIAESSRGKLTADELLRLCAGGGVTLFIIVDDDASLLATVLTEFAQYPRKKVCRVIGCVGQDRDRWVHHLSEIESWARGHGCGSMQNIGRKGWLRDLKAAGYRCTHYLFEKELGDAQEAFTRS